MRILHVISSLNPKGGGVSQALRTMAKGLAELKIYNEVACIDAASAEYLSKENFPVYALGPGKSSWGYNPKFFNWVKQNLKNYDIVIIHGLWQYPGYATYKAWETINNKKPRLFLMPHGMLDPYFQQAKNRKLKAIRNIVYWRLIESKIVNNVEGILFTCEEECVLAREPFRTYNPKHQIVIGLGVDDPPPFRPEMRKLFLEKCPEIRNHPYFLFLSRIHEKKGIDLLLNAYAELSREINAIVPYEVDNSFPLPAELPKLVIAGPNLESSFGQKMQRLVSENPDLSKMIFFVGMLSGNAKWGAFYGCEAFVLPSHQENFGIAIVEAMACSKPVLISNKVNIWKEIQQSGGGMVADDTEKETKKMLEKWRILPCDKKVTMASRANHCFKKYFTISAASSRLKGAISKLPL